jgi:hypothetical protein
MKGETFLAANLFVSKLQFRVCCDVDNARVKEREGERERERERDDYEK